MNTLNQICCEYLYIKYEFAVIINNPETTINDGGVEHKSEIILL